MIPLEDALMLVDETLASVRLAGSETLSVRRTLGRTLAADQHAAVDLPPFNKSAMDGYAALQDDERDEYKLLGTVAAGEVCRFRMTPGTCVKVMTGAPVPEGAGRVIMVEHTEEHDGVVTVRKHGGDPNICIRAEDVHHGQMIMAAGTTLGPLEIGNLISCGVTEVEVLRRVRVAIISTGDEIVDDPARLGPGKIMNANGPMLAGLADDAGLEVIGEESVGDDAASTVSAVRRALEHADVVVASGGVSVGEFDYVLGALCEAGLTVHFTRVAVKPGKPTVYATVGGKVFFGLPGNPVSAFLMFHLFVLRAVARMTSRDFTLREITLRMGGGFTRRKTVRREFVPSRLSDDGHVVPLEYHGSAHLLALTQADGFCVVPVGVAALSEGDPVTFVPFRRLSKW